MGWWKRVCGATDSLWQAGRSTETDQGLSSVYSACQVICKSLLGSYHGFFPEVKAFSFLKLSNEIFNSQNQTKLRFHFVLPAMAQIFFVTLGIIQATHYITKHRSWCLVGCISISRGTCKKLCLQSHMWVRNLGIPFISFFLMIDTVQCCTGVCISASVAVL